MKLSDLPDYDVMSADFEVAAGMNLLLSGGHFRAQEVAYRLSSMLSLPHPPTDPIMLSLWYGMAATLLAVRAENERREGERR